MDVDNGRSISGCAAFFAAHRTWAANGSAAILLPGVDELPPAANGPGGVQQECLDALHRVP